jgi:predicted RNase H-like nuclease (RuvC/YqgF family)
LFQENCQRSENEQKLYIEWQHAVRGWRNAEEAWKNVTSEIGQLQSVVNNLQKHIEELKAQTMKMDVAVKTLKTYHRGEKANSGSSVWFPKSTLHDRSGSSNYYYN